jgi:hypothetical protein
MNDVIITVVWRGGAVDKYRCTHAGVADGYIRLTQPNTGLMFIPYTSILYWTTEPAGGPV